MSDIIQQQNLFNPIFKALAQSIAHAIKTLYPDVENLEISTEQIYSMLGLAPNLKMGHIAFACFPLAKALRKGPPQIAAELKDVVANCPIISQVQALGPYLNFFIKNESLGELVIGAANSHELFDLDLFSNKDKWMIEYSQPNTHKILHVGHMRNLCLGNALVHMCRYSGIETSAVTYPGDVGTHVAKCLWYFKYHNQESVPTQEKGAWIGQMYTKGNTLLEDQKGTEKEEENRKQLTEILKQLHDQEGEFYDLWRETKAWSVELMEEAYRWSNVTFDRWFWESEVDAPSLNYAKELYAKGLLIKSEGAIGMDLSENSPDNGKEKLGFCMLIKSDGTGLYATKDVELARRKFKEFGIDKNIYVVDNRQAYHFKQVFKVLEKIGFEQARDCHHLQYEMVELPDGAMSSRKGNIVPLMDLVSQMEATIKESYLNKYLDSGEWTLEEVNQSATMIANGAIKYGMIRVDNNRKIVFDMNEWLKLDGETGPYLQYVHARIYSLCAKLGYNDELQVDWDLLSTQPEIALMVKLMDFNHVVAFGVQKLQTLGVCSYLYELGKLFNSFYAECPIGKARPQELKNTRLALAHATGEVMRVGLEMLGIPAPLKM